MRQPFMRTLTHKMYDFVEETFMNEFLYKFISSFVIPRIKRYYVDWDRHFPLYEEFKHHRVRPRLLLSLLLSFCLYYASL